MENTNTILYDLIDRVHDTLNKVGIKIPKILTITIIIHSFLFMMFERKNMLKDILKCNNDGVMGPIAITPNITHKGRRSQISEWIRINGLGMSFNVGNKLDELIRRSGMYSVVETSENPIILRPDPLLVLMVMNMSIIIMAEIAKDLGIARIGLSSFSATDYDGAWVVVDISDGHIRVEL